MERRRTNNAGDKDDAHAQKKRDEVSRRAETRARFAKFLSAADTFLNSYVECFEDFVDPHNEAAVTAMFKRMATDNVVRAHLPKFAAGTAFSTTLRALATLSLSATTTCTHQMATAAHNAHTATATRQHTVARNENVTTIPSANNATPDTTTTTALPNTAPTPDDAIVSYLTVARKSRKPKPIHRLPPPTPTRISPDSDANNYSTKLRSAAARISATWIGHEQKNLLEAASDTPLTNPSHLRQILTFSGIRAPIAVLPTDDSTKTLICAADSVLDKVKKSFDNFVKVCDGNPTRIPKLIFTKVRESDIAKANAADTRRNLNAIRKEVLRLEAVDCTWRPRGYFASRLRELEKAVHNRCTQIEGDGAPPQFPDNPHSLRPNKRTRPTDETMEATATPTATPTTNNDDEMNIEIPSGQGAASGPTLTPPTPANGATNINDTTSN